MRTITLDEYDKQREHEYAGPEGDGTAWVMGWETGSGTVLYRHVEVEGGLLDGRTDYCETCDHFNPLGSLGEPCEHGI